MKYLIYFFIIFNLFSEIREDYAIDIPNNWKEFYSYTDNNKIESISYIINENIYLEIFSGEVDKMLTVHKLLGVNSGNYITKIKIKEYEGKLHQLIKEGYIRRYLTFTTEYKSYLIVIETDKNSYLNYEKELLEILNTFQIETTNYEEKGYVEKKYFEINLASDWRKSKNIFLGEYLQKEVYIKDNSYIEIRAKKRITDDLSTDLYWAIDKSLSEMHINSRKENLDLLIPHIKLTYIYQNRDKRVHYFLYSNQMLIELIYNTSPQEYKDKVKEIEEIFGNLKLLN